MKTKLFFLFLFQSLLLGAQTAQPADAAAIQPAVFALSKVMMHDVVSPPAASRYYTYCMLGAYEIVAKENKTLPLLGSLIKNYNATSIHEPISTFNAAFAALYCILETGKQLLPSGYLLDEDLKKLKQQYQKKLPAAIVKESIALAEEMANGIIAFSKSDHYNQLSARLRYTPVKAEGMWYPTPPTYMEAVEPNWKTIRPFMLDSCNEFMPARPTAYSTDTASTFYKLAHEVYEKGKTATSEQRAIAGFWDCNPFAVATAGHMALGFKKISPGGHWMNIAGVASKKAKLPFGKSILVQTVVAITLADAFVSCWDEKYRSNRIRPETYITRLIDAQWEPLLQTPPFPEYPSGHSVISTAAAEVLSFFFGDSFQYTDDTEVLFDIPPRIFQSFRQAAAEAAISRLYGGIHFRDAVESGKVEGAAIGAKMVGFLKSAGVSPVAATAK